MSDVCETSLTGRAHRTARPRENTLARMIINYTDRVTMLMHDIVSRVPELSFIDTADLLVFARAGRSEAEGAFATCHCLSLPPSEPGYYFWRERCTGKLTRRSEWFVTKSPVVTVGNRQIKYLVSIVLPRFCDQTLGQSRKERLYGDATGSWIAKLDTIVHELYHIDPNQNGIRRLCRHDGSHSANCHSPAFFQQVTRMVRTYLDSRPDPEVFDFLRYDFAALEIRYSGVVARCFRTFPSYPHRFVERLAVQPHCDGELADVAVVPIRIGQQPTCYTDADLYVRQFVRDTRDRRIRKRQVRAA
jgi:hypothetical protein